MRNLLIRNYRTIQNDSKMCRARALVLSFIFNISSMVMAISENQNDSFCNPNVYRKGDNSTLSYCSGFLSFPTDFNRSEEITNLFITRGTGSRTNYITTLPSGAVEKLPNLIFLSVSGGRITDIQKGAFKGANKLIKLFLSNNQITKIDLNLFSDLPKLEYLSLSKNPLGTLQEKAEFPAMNLKKLSLYNCSLTFVPTNLFRNLDKLESVDLSKNLLTTLDISVVCPLSALEEIRLWANPWRCDCSTVELMKLLDESQVWYGTGHVRQNSVLSQFQFNTDKTKAYPGQIAYSYNKCRRAEFQLSELNTSNSTNERLVGASWNTVAVSGVSCSGDLVKKRQHNQCNLKERGIIVKTGSCRAMNESDIDAKVNNLNLKVSVGFVCRGVQNTFPPNLEMSQEITALSLVHQTGYYIKDAVPGNFIPELLNLQLKKLPNLELLNLARCRISDVKLGAFQGGSNLKLLVLASNHLHVLDPMVFADLIKLEALYLKDNPIRQFEDYHRFPKLDQLRILDLSQCKLDKISFKLLANLKNLQEINLSRNRFFYLDPNIFLKNKNLINQRLNGNPWHCDCRLKSLVQQFKAKLPNMTRKPDPYDIYKYYSIPSCASFGSNMSCVSKLDGYQRRWDQIELEVFICSNTEKDEEEFNDLDDEISEEEFSEDNAILDDPGSKEQERPSLNQRDEEVALEPQSDKFPWTWMMAVILLILVVIFLLPANIRFIHQIYLKRKERQADNLSGRTTFTVISNVNRVGGSSEAVEIGGTTNTTTV